MNDNSDLKKIVANNLSQLRKAKGLTQIQLADMFNYSDKAVSKWERGDTTPDLETLKALADFYGVTLDYLVTSPNLKEQQKMYVKEKKTVSTKAIGFIACMIPPLIAVAIYLILQLSIGYNYWLLFLWWIPLDALLLFIFSWIWWGKKKRSMFGILFSWAACICTYLELGTRLENNLGWNTWEILLIAIPLTIALLLWMRVVKKSDN